VAASLSKCFRQPFKIRGFRYPVREKEGLPPFGEVGLQHDLDAIVIGKLHDFRREFGFPDTYDLSEESACQITSTG